MSLARVPLIGVSVCVWRGDEVLLVERGKPPAEGLWAPVGGMLEWGETLEAAALREVAEETGVACRIVGRVDPREMIFRDAAGTVERHVVLVVHAAVWTGGEPVAGDDARAARFVAHDALASVPLIPGTEPFLAATRALVAARRGA